jgi:hypothetical protein
MYGHRKGDRDVSLYPSVGRDWKHKLAGFLHRPAHKGTSAVDRDWVRNHNVTETATSEGSIGRNCKRR